MCLPYNKQTLHGANVCLVPIEMLGFCSNSIKITCMCSDF